MDPDPIEQFAVGFIAVKFSFLAGFFLVRLYQGGRLGLFCVDLIVSLLLRKLWEEISA